MSNQVLTQTQIRITYYGDQEPKVVILGKMEGIDIELIDGEEAKWLYMEHAGIQVYHTTHFPDMFNEFWFSTVRGQEGDTDEAFDVRDLRLTEVQRLAMDFLEVFKGEPYKQAIAQAIDCGRLTEEGLRK